MKWRTALTAAAVMAAVTVPVVALAGADPASAQQPGIAADSGRGECPLNDETATIPEDMHQWMEPAAHGDWMRAAEHTERHHQMHGAEGSVGEGMMGGRISPGPMMNPGVPKGQMTGHGPMMGSAMGG